MVRLSGGFDGGREKGQLNALLSQREETADDGVFFSFINRHRTFFIAELYPFIDVEEPRFGFALQHRPSPCGEG